MNEPTNADYASLSRLLVAAGYADRALVFGEVVHIRFTTLGQTRLRELYDRLAELPEPGSAGRRAALLALLAELTPLAPSASELEACVNVCLLHCRNPDAPR